MIDPAVWVGLASALALLAARPMEAIGLPGSPQAVPAPPRKPFAPPRPQRFELAGGARLLVLEDHELPLASGTLYFRAGALAEPPDKAGLASLLADSLREGGSRSTPGPELDAWLDQRAAEIEIGLERDTLWLRFHCLAADTARVLALAFELLREPAYPADALERSRERLLSAIARRDDSAAAMADRALLRASYGCDSPWAREADEASVRAIAAADVQRYHRENLGAARLVLGLCGDLDASALRRQVQELVGKLPVLSPGPVLDPPLFQVPAATRIFLLDRPGVPQSELRVTAPGVARSDPDYAALYLWSHAVGLGMTSRMTARVRTELGLAYSVGALWRAEWDVPGRLYAWCGTRNDACERALTEMLEVLAQSSQVEISASEIEAARERLLNAEVFRVDSSEKVLQRCLDLEYRGYPADFHELVEKRVRELTPEQVLAAARRHLRAQQLVCVGVGPLAALRERLERVAACTELEREPGARGTPAGRALAERVLAALGGAPRWAALDAIELEGVNTLQAGQTEIAVPLHQWRSLNERRLRLEYQQQGATVLSVIGGARGYKQSPLGRERLGPEELAAMTRADGRWLYRILHELAAGSARIGAREGAHGRFEIHTDLGLECWLELGGDGRPTALAYEEAGREVRFDYERWAEVEGLHYVAALRQSQPLGRLEVKRFVANPKLAPELFASPFGD